MTDVLAQAHAGRVSALFTRYGEAFTRIRAGVSQRQLAVFAPLDSTAIGTYFDGNESVGLLRPALTLFADGALADPPVADDVFFRDGRFWTIRKTHVFRFVSTPLLILALCD